MICECGNKYQLRTDRKLMCDNCLTVAIRSLPRYNFITVKYISSKPLTWNIYFDEIMSGTKRLVYEFEPFGMFDPKLVYQGMMLKTLTVMPEGQIRCYLEKHGHVKMVKGSRDAV